MSYFLIAVAVVALGLAAVKAVSSANPVVVVLWTKRIIAGVVGGAAALMFLMGRVPVALILASVALMILRSGGMRLGRLGGKPTGGQSSSVETDMFSMSLDHDSGEMNGDVKSGKHAGKRLSELSKYDLLSILEQLKYADQQSAAVLVSYLDRRFGVDWQEDVAGQSAGNSGSDGPMTRDVALEILGLTKDASQDEIVRAHRDLMHKLHPDHGGSDYLATRINAARDFLIG